MSKKNVLIGAETGSGKTLAYLLPTIQTHQNSPVLIQSYKFIIDKSTKSNDNSSKKRINYTSK